MTDKMCLVKGNPMTKVLMAVLIFETIVAGLSIAVMIQVSDLNPGVASTVGAVLMVLSIAAAGNLRRGAPGFILGWLTQIAFVASGFLTSGMWVMAAVFGGLWVTCFILGKRLETGRDVAS